MNIHRKSENLARIQKDKQIYKEADIHRQPEI